MPNLLDTIRQNSAVQPVGEQDQTGKLAALLRAKSGKAVGGGDTLSSNLGEQQANVQTNAQLGQVAAQGGIQQAGQQAQQQAQQSELATAKSGIAQQNRFNTIETKMKTNQMLDEYSRNKGTLDLAQDKSKVAQLGFNLRMQNQQYTDNLQREGDRSRLDNELQFKQEMAKQNFGDNEQLFRSQLGNRSILDVNQNEFNRAMGSMSQDQAYEAFHNSIANDKQRAIYTGIGGVLGAGAGAGATAYNQKANAPGSKENPGGGFVMDEGTAASSDYGTTDIGGAGSMGA